MHLKLCVRLTTAGTPTSTQLYLKELTPTLDTQKHSRYEIDFGEPELGAFARRSKDNLSPDPP